MHSFSKVNNIHISGVIVYGSGGLPVGTYRMKLKHGARYHFHSLTHQSVHKEAGKERHSWRKAIRGIIIVRDDFQSGEKTLIFLPG